MEIQNIFVVGSGLMGSGIAQVFAQAGMTVTIHDENDEALKKAETNIAWSVGKLIEKGRLEESQAQILERIHYAPAVEAAETADLVIEAIFENQSLKQEIFKKLDAVCQKEAFLASNTSTIPITELASVTQRPERVLGLHFFSPVPMMRAVEVVSGVATSEETMKMGVEACSQGG